MDLGGGGGWVANLFAISGEVFPPTHSHKFTHIHTLVCGVVLFTCTPLTPHSLTGKEFHAQKKKTCDSLFIKRKTQE